MVNACRNCASPGNFWPVPRASGPDALEGAKVHRDLELKLSYKGDQIVKEGWNMTSSPFRACVGTAAMAFCLAAFLFVSNLPAGTAANAQTAEHARVWIGPDGNPLPFKNDEEVLEFLRTAEVVSMKNIAVGTTLPRQAVLEKDGIRSKAVFRDFDEEKESFQVRGQRERGVRDSYIFECAAYELARLLGLDSVPPVVERVVNGKRGSVQIWVENAMTEKDRVGRGLRSPNIIQWNKQMQTVSIFDALIANWDRNQGNILIDKDWRLWMIDHTRAFLRRDDLGDVARLYQCDRELWQKLQGLNEAEVRQRLKPYLRGPEIDSLLKRRTKLVAFFKAQIDKRGESDVLY